MTNPGRDLTFVLVRTQFASNLGSAVRSMKNMGFENLILVRPECEVGIEARSFAMKGSDILDRARFFPSLEAVSREIGVLIGTTGRFKGSRPRLTDLPTLVEEILPEVSGNPVGIVFGSEDNGLRKEELRVCQWLVEIPTAPEFPVINLAQSVAIVAYAIHLHSRKKHTQESPGRASHDEIEALLQRADQLIRSMEFPARVSIDRIMQRLRKIAVKAQFERGDIKLLHGLLKQAGRRPDGSEK